MHRQKLSHLVVYVETKMCTTYKWSHTIYIKWEAQKPKTYKPKREGPNIICLCVHIIVRSWMPQPLHPSSPNVVSRRCYSWLTWHLSSEAVSTPKSRSKDAVSAFSTKIIDNHANRQLNVWGPSVFNSNYLWWQQSRQERRMKRNDQEGSHICNFTTKISTNILKNDAICQPWRGEGWETRRGLWSAWLANFELETK